MKRLFLLRHAKAEGRSAAGDAERVLATRGRRDMEAIAAHFAQEGIAPDLALVSPAARTRETWTLAGLPGIRAVFERRIYDATLGTLLSLVREAPPGAGSLIVVGHNPGLEELAAHLVEARRAREVDILPTGAFVTITFDGPSWSVIGPGAGRLVSLVTPADLGAGKDA